MKRLAVRQVGRIAVSRSYDPCHLQNLATGADNIDHETRRGAARRNILHDAGHPSSVLLPVIPPQPAKEKRP